MAASVTPLESRTLLSADYTATIGVIEKSYLRGEVVPITVHVMNSGTSGTFLNATHNVVLSKDKLFGNADDVPISAFSTQGLAKGQVVSRNVTPTLGSNVPAGKYYVVVKLDATNVVNESNEANVFFSDGPSVTVASDDLPSGPITGTGGNDVIVLRQAKGKLIVTVNGVARAGNAPSHLFIDAGAGNDKVVADASVTTRLQITGNVGADTLVGGGAKDEISGSYGMDKVWGGGGDDFLLGGAHNDYLAGEAGNDLMIAAGGHDRLIDVIGKDYFIGGIGNDQIFAHDTTNNAVHGPDTISGHGGYDAAQVDTGPFADAYTSIEELIP